MDQLICASLSHTYFWYEVGMLKVPADFIEEQLNEEPRLQWKHKDANENETKNKTNVTPEKGNMTSANQTPGRHKFAPLVANQL